MIGDRGAWGIVMMVAAGGFACGSSVTVVTGGTAGASTSSTPAGGTGGSGDIGGSEGPGGSSTGGAGAGGAGAGGALTGGAGAGGSGGVAGSGGSGGGMVCEGLGDPCTGCMSAQCSSVWCACIAEPHCGGYLECLGTCVMGDTACYQNCATVHEAGISNGILVSDCAASTCDASCTFGKALMPCQKCLYTDCQAQMNACLADAECVALVQCLGMCMPGDMACGQACVSTHPDGLMKALGVRDCRIASCNDMCP